MKQKKFKKPENMQEWLSLIRARREAFDEFFGPNYKMANLYDPVALKAHREREEAFVKSRPDLFQAKEQPATEPAQPRGDGR